jgi:hypothetical protein|tara:strand:+ start:19 stop:693 length:675 start_codon:yes stop_codon:yes gene_type:complete
MDISFNTKPAVGFMSVDFNSEVIEELNTHIDDELIDCMDRAEPIKFSHTLDYVGKMFGDYVCRLSDTYMKNANKDIVTDEKATEYTPSITGDEHREYNPKMISMNIERIFSGTTQQGNTDGELSCILYLKVPEQIAGKIAVPNWGMVDDGKAEKSNEGYTHLSWGSVSEASLLKPVTEQYLRPELGKMIMFPSWLNYVILPFSGEGESRVLTANVNLTEKQNEH